METDVGWKYRDRIRLYADVGHGRGNTPEGWAQRAKEGVADGYQAIKFDIDNSANELKQDAVNRELIQTQSCDMLHVDVSGTGGILEAKKIADLADLYYMPFAAHNITSPIGMTATAHVCAAVRNFIVIELPYHADQVDWRWDLAISEEPLMQDNAFVVPAQPGLGVEINAEVAREHLMPGSDHFGIS